MDTPYVPIQHLFHLTYTANIHRQVPRHSSGLATVRAQWCCGADSTGLSSVVLAAQLVRLNYSIDGFNGARDNGAGLGHSVHGMVGHQLKGVTKSLSFCWISIIPSQILSGSTGLVSGLGWKQHKWVRVTNICWHPTHNMARINSDSFPAYLECGILFSLFVQPVWNPLSLLL